MGWLSSFDTADLLIFQQLTLGDACMGIRRLALGCGMMLLLGGGTAMSFGDEPNPAERKVAEAGRVDGHSYSNPRQVRVEHLELHLTVDFEKKELRGEVAI